MAETATKAAPHRYPPRTMPRAALLSAAAMLIGRTLRGLRGMVQSPEPAQVRDQVALLLRVREAHRAHRAEYGAPGTGTVVQAQAPEEVRLRHRVAPVERVLVVEPGDAAQRLGGVAAPEQQRLAPEHPEPAVDAP